MKEFKCDVTLSMRGHIVYQNGNYAALDMNDFSDMYIAIDTTDNSVKGFSYEFDRIIKLIDELKRYRDENESDNSAAD